MAKQKALVLLYCFVSTILITNGSCAANGLGEDSRKAYIVYMGSLPKWDSYSPSSDHLNLLQEVVRDRSTSKNLITSYKRSFNGFAAWLTDKEAQKLARRKEVASVFPSRTFQLQTTRSWDFMGLLENSTRNPSIESDVIIGVIDSGIWPESESFNDQGLGPPPKKWKGACKGGNNFTCNNKIIGARFYDHNTATSARDDEGHGTHTASTAAGKTVTGASFYGIAEGNARGGAPSARIAVYKACSDSSCPGVNLLTAFDDAIADGVDIITISIGLPGPNEMASDPIAIGAFHAMEKGKLTVHSAGNNGPQEGTTSSIAPWLLSVAASSLDRRIIDKVVLGNGKTIIGNSVNAFDLKGKQYPITDVLNKSSSFEGKIVLGESLGDIEPAGISEPAGFILHSRRIDVSFVYPLPALALNNDKYEELRSYYNSTDNPVATLLKSEDIEDCTAPVVVSFSSRGPNTMVADILKPDVTAPGVDILAAYSPLASPSGRPLIDKRQVKYSVLSGTSMACPHVAGIAAYVKSFHPDWSPSAIKSAIMTTAWAMNDTRNPDGEFGYGSGHVNPVKAIDPGLVYELTQGNYLQLLCNLGYSSDMIKRITVEDSTCPPLANQELVRDLNYPSLAARVPTKKPFSIKFQRTVTNVGTTKSSYTAKVFITGPIELNITVMPTVLSFGFLNESKSFEVSVVGNGLPSNVRASASLLWSDATHSVRSPIVVYTDQRGDFD